ncbi:TPA: C40 family peptidase [Bacillus nitratireducens]|nr:Gamma-DL-glutamyl hydrolase [Bacillus cereus AH1272]EEL91048.1 Gamma-DL-glutamyl hydrolase [Bacillus cereus AH1273]GCF76380.1 hypothetical protein BC2926_39210 [Bacillus cereus]
MKKVKTIAIVLLVFLININYISSAAASTEKEQTTSKLVDYAKSLLGKSYESKGTTPQTGFDPSGLIYHVYSQNGYDIPRSTTLNYWNMLAETINPEPGDLVFFKDTYTKGISHVGIVIDDGTFIHVTKNSGVIQSKLDSTYYTEHFAGYRTYVNPTNNALVDYAKSLIGKPYSYGNQSPSEGFDSSGFVYHVYNEFGNYITRSSVKEYWNTLTPTEHPKAGDLVFFNNKDTAEITSAGILGENNFFFYVTNPQGVRMSSLNEAYYKEHLAGYRTFIKPATNPMLDYAMTLIGVPYVFGGYDPNTGLDCSGFVYNVFNKFNKEIPRLSAEQLWKADSLINSVTTTPTIGDLVFFKDTYKKGISHMGIIIGDGYYIHAAEGKGVTIGNINDAFSKKHFVGYKRYYAPGSNALTTYATSLLNKPFAKGGTSPKAGFDSSGLIFHVYNKFNKPIARNTVLDYWNMMKTTFTPQLGDLVFFKDTSKPGISHIGIMIGGGYFIHASSSKGVAKNHIAEEYYQQHFAGYKTIP